MPFKYNALLGLGLDNTIPLDGAGKIPSTFLPSYVDDVEEYNNLAAFPATGETGKIYVAIDTGFVYRWSGSVYVQIGITAAAGSTTQVQFNDAGAFGGDSGLTFDKTTDALSAGGFIPTSSTVPANGIYLPAANSVGVATNGTRSLYIDATGNVFAGKGTTATILGGTTAAGGGLTDKDLTLRAWSPVSGTNEYAGDLYLAVGPGTGGGSGKLGTVYIQVGKSGSPNDSPGSVVTALSADYSTIIAKTAEFERARIDSSGRLLIGTSTARGNFFNSTVSAALQVEGTGNDSSSLSIVRNSADTGRAILTLAKTRGGSVGSTTVVQSGDALGSIEFQGSDGTEFVQAAAIQCEVDGTPSANDMPGRIVLSVTADGAASPTEAMRIKSTGIINFSNAPTYADNTAATAAGLAVGDVYKTVLGVLMIRF